MQTWEEVYARDWLGFDWSPWISLDSDQDGLEALETDPGLYRVRHPAYDGLVYVGETGRSVRGRLRALARGIHDEQMPFSDPHTGSPCLWAIVDDHGPGFEVSATTPPEAADSQQRKAIEDALIAVHRRETETNLVGNFGRMPPGYEKSKTRSTGVRGGRCDESPRSFREGIDPLPWENPEALTASDWMGLSWTDPAPLRDVGQQVPAEPGLYRIWRADQSPPLEYVGQTVNLRSRLRTHRRNRDETLQFAYVHLPDLEQQFERLQAESTLLGAHWLACESAPRSQY